MRACNYIADFLAAVGVERVYTLSGGMIAPMLDAIGEHPRLRLVPVSHEQSAAFAAENEAKLTGLPGVAIGTNGPGALNLVTGVASAFCDSVPAIFIGGQVQTYLSNLVPGARQSGLQQADFAAVCRPIAKDVICVRAASDLPGALERAYVTALSGRQGPVVLDVPLDVQIAATGASAPRSPRLPMPLVPSEADRSRLASELAASRQPVLLVGGGAHGAEEACRRLATAHGLPVVATTAGIDVAAGLGPLYVGMCGMYGSRAANTILTEADLVLVLGSRLDHGVLGGDPAGFARKRKVWQVDIDPAEAAVRAKPAQSIVADLRATLEALEVDQALAECEPQPKWLARVAEVVAAFPTVAEQPPMDGIDPNYFAGRLGVHSQDAAAYVVDAGQHTWWVGQSLPLGAHQRFLTSTGLHACGTALPGAIAAALCLQRPVVLVAGDGAIQLNIQDLATIDRERLPVKTVILNNGAHGSVRQFQVEAVQGRHHAAVWGLSEVNFPAVFQAYGVPARRIERPSQIEDALAWLWANPAQAQMLEVVIDTDLLVRPAVAFGRQISAMSPSVQGAPRYVAQ
jgi:acetolactate synthase-1/2/3 large subunit